MPINGGVAFGDTKRRDLDGALRFTDKEMLAHILAVKAGQYDHLIPDGTELRPTGRINGPCAQNTRLGPSRVPAPKWIQLVLSVS
ncbi:hypothetical protein ACFXKG_31110 [Streptomyces sp. NPDC059255]|uniref:hypothetical protein n=1 Tax=Streptomyces sp. NPDC059255 TaxID=3346793 RepID=UPI003697ABE8